MVVYYIIKIFYKSEGIFIFLWNPIIVISKGRKGGNIMNSTLELLNNRMSLRKYDDKPISEEDLNAIIQGALRAPTAGNMMMYSILVIKDPKKKEILSKTCDDQPFIATAPVVLIFLADMERLYSYYNYSKVDEYCKENNMDFRKPDASSLYLATSDAIIAAQNAVIAAEALGIGSCYIGDIIENYETHKDLLNLSPWTMPVAMLTLGYYPENQTRRITSRFDKKYIVFDEEYKKLEDEDFAHMYKDLETLVKENNVYKAKNFGQLLYGRKMGSDFAKEMERSLNVMIDKWMNR